MLSKEATKVIETAILNGKEVKITIEVNNASSATRSRQLVNKTGAVPPPPPPRTLGEDNPFMPKRPTIRVVNEGGCLSFIALCGMTLGTILYII